MNILGIDIGGTGIKGALVNTATGQVLGERKRIPTPSPSKPENILEAIQEIVGHFNWKGSIGCGFPTVVAHGESLSVSNLHKSWYRQKVDKLIADKVGLPTYVLNDADAAGLAEMTFGEGKDIMGTVIVLTIGTGIGSSVFIDGRLVPNVELGSMRYKNNEIIEKYTAESIRKKEGLSYKEFGGRLNELLHYVHQIFLPDLIILGGGTSKRMDKFSDQFTVVTPVVPAATRNHAGIIGAALAASKYLH